MPAGSFAQKCHEMVSCGHGTIGWSPEGDTVWVSNPERLGRELIPKYYGHSSYASWTRALHAHSFHKISPSTWAHPKFHRDLPVLNDIVRKKANKSRPAAAASGSDQVGQSSSWTLDPLQHVAMERPESLERLVLFADDLVEKETLEFADDFLAELGCCGDELFSERSLESCEVCDFSSACDFSSESGVSSEAGRDEPDYHERPHPGTLRRTGHERVPVPSSEVAARLKSLREQISLERKCTQQLKATIEKMEAHSTQVRNEELELRNHVNSLNELISTIAISPAIATTMLATLGAVAAFATQGIGDEHHFPKSSADSITPVGCMSSTQAAVDIPIPMLVSCSA